MRKFYLSTALLTWAAMGCGQSNPPSAPSTSTTTVTATPVPVENAETPEAHDLTLEADDLQLVTLRLPGMT
ncbi:MAG TPA: hypothetical protein VK137_12700 [Planctomycetaceae bacterium]|nr:hypothetical protein [Planctomycetaceae bacterium]